jgi:hypothetical protein
VKEMKERRSCPQHSLAKTSAEMLNVPDQKLFIRNTLKTAKQPG